MSYIIKDYTKKQALKMGLEVKPSKRKGKKIDVYMGGKFMHAIGALGMMDYPSYLEKEGKAKADERRRLCLVGGLGTQSESNSLLREEWFCCF